MKDNRTSDTIFKILKDNLDSQKVKVVRKGDFPAPKNSVQYATIVIKANDRPEAFELVEDVLKDNNIKYKEEKLTGSSFNGFEIKDYYKIGKRESSIRVIFKYANGRDTAAKTGSIWNDLLIQLFRTNPSLERSPRDRSEVEVVKKINAAIQNLGSYKPVDLQIKSKRYSNVAGIIAGRGTKKADFVIVDYSGEEIGFISYKAGTNALSFQQYGGITDRASTDISNHQEVKDFKEIIIDNWDTYKSDYKTVWRSIEDNKLKKSAVFGPDYNRQSGYDSVDFVVQGVPRLKKVGATLDKRSIIKLNFSSKVIRKNNLTALQGNYEPTIGVRSGERSRRIRLKNKSISGVRGGVFTRAYLTRGKNKEI